MEKANGLAVAAEYAAKNEYVLITGDTRKHKRELKDLRATWSPSQLAWSMHPATLRRVLDSHGEGFLPTRWIYQAIESGELMVGQ